jgi:hypothetical protein
MPSLWEVPSFEPGSCVLTWSAVYQRSTNVLALQYFDMACDHWMHLTVLAISTAALFQALIAMLQYSAQSVHRQCTVSAQTERYNNTSLVFSTKKVYKTLKVVSAI